MSTRSIIGYKMDNGKIRNIYCHYDGYLSYNGRILLESYNTLDKVKELVSHGSLSYLESKVNPIGNNHTFGTPESGVCVYYGRDRGEDWEQVKYNDNTLEELLDGGLSYIEYYYIFDNGHWYVIDHESELKVLTMEMCENEGY